MIVFMKRFLILLAFLLVATHSTVKAQPAPAPDSTPEATASASAPKDDAAKSAPAKPGAIVLPPEKANPVRVAKFESAPVIDGKLDDEVWKQAIVLKDFYQVQPGDNIAPSKPTEVLLGYDAKFLYVAYRAFDEPD